MELLQGPIINDNIRLALILPYSEMAQDFTRLTKKVGIKPYIAFATLGEAAAIARDIESETDVILSRGGTAEYIKEVVDIPVVSISITSFDALMSVYSVKDHVNEIAFFNFRQKMVGMREIENIFNIKIYEYIFYSEQNIEESIQEVKARGIKVVIGGAVAVRLALKYGLKGVLIECGEEAISLSVQQAIHLAQVRRQERSRTAKFKMILDSAADGIIVTDEQNIVTIYNPAAERIFHIPSIRVIGQDVEEVIPNTRMHKVLESGKAELAVLQEIRGGTIATNRIPIILDEKCIGVVSTFEDVTKIQQLEQQIRKRIYAKGFIAKCQFKDILTANPEMIGLKEIAALYATTDSSVLIQGESGTGKELFAQSIHNASQRSKGPFVAVNCAAIPEHLLESELFGYEGGAFTGAKREGKQGLFELAHNGTIFLDEIGEIPNMLQARLLRVLQEKEIMKVGGDKIIPVDIRIISATNKDLKKKVNQGEFRDDLYYRLNVFNLELLPLRKRTEDIILLTLNFLEKFDVTISNQVAEELRPLLIAYDWPGNVRELYNVLERLSLLASHCQPNTPWVDLVQKIMQLPIPNENSINIKVDIDKGLRGAIGQVERKVIDFMLMKYGQNQELVAQKLGIGRTTLWRKGKTEGI